METNPVKNLSQDIQCLLQAGWLWQSKKPVVGVKERHQTLDFLSEPFLSHLLSHDHHYPVLNHCFHYHVEYGVREGISLGDHLVALEQGSVIVPQACHNVDVLPVESDYPLHLRLNHVARHNIHSLLPIQGVIGLPGVN